VAVPVHQPSPLPSRSPSSSLFPPPLPILNSILPSSPFFSSPSPFNPHLLSQSQWKVCYIMIYPPLTASRLRPQATSTLSLSKQLGRAEPELELLVIIPTLIWNISLIRLVSNRGSRCSRYRQWVCDESTGRLRVGPGVWGSHAARSRPSQSLPP
jgi:hypothetical protein